MSKELFGQLFGESFPPASYEAWRNLVEKSLGGASIEDALATQLPAGTGEKIAVDTITVQPLYVSAPSFGADSGLWLRGVPSDAGREPELATRVDAPLIAEAAEQIRNDAKGGAQSAIIVLDELARFGEGQRSQGTCSDGLSLSSSEELGMLLSSAATAKLPLIFDAGVSGLGLGALLASRPAEEKSCIAGVWHDPLSAIRKAGPFATSWDGLYHEAEQVQRELGPLLPGAALFAVDGRSVHEAGASAVQELSYILSHAITLFRELEARGISPLLVAERLNVVVGVGPDFFLEIAKMRALRVLWQNLVTPLGGNISLRVTALTARWNRTRDDPHTNLLRATVESLSAFCGDVDRLCALPFLLRGDGEEPLARRMSRSIHHILNEEALLGRVQDPAGGSYYVESLTKVLYEHAWSHFQKTESAGGLRAVLEAGTFQQEVAALRDAHAEGVTSGTAKMVGLNAFRDTSDLPRLQRYELEAMRKARRQQLDSQQGAAAQSLLAAPGTFAGMVSAASAGVGMPVFLEKYRAAGRSLSAGESLWNPPAFPEFCLQSAVDGSPKPKVGAK
jgi:methylmalonyl-CoA mutase